MNEEKLIEEFKKAGFYHSKGINELKFSRPQESISYVSGELFIFLRIVSDKELYLIKELAKLKGIAYDS